MTFWEKRVQSFER